MLKLMGLGGYYSVPCIAVPNDAGFVVRLLKEQHPETNWDAVEQKNHSIPKKP
jgi:hypothetical protein